MMERLSINIMAIVVSQFIDVGPAGVSEKLNLIACHTIAATTLCNY
jgi:hypothetical protein